jgi:hypothetical protein
MIQALHSGKKDRLIYLLNMTATIMVIVICSASCIIGGAVVIALAPTISPPSSFSDAIFAFVLLGSLLACAATGLLVAWHLNSRFLYVTGSLDDFDTYLMSYDSKWNSPVKASL